LADPLSENVKTAVLPGPRELAFLAPGDGDKSTLELIYLREPGWPKGQQLNANDIYGFVYHRWSFTEFPEPPKSQEGRKFILTVRPVSDTN
jgi:hypothetical protein